MWCSPPCFEENVACNEFFFNHPLRPRVSAVGQTLLLVGRSITNTVIEFYASMSTRNIIVFGQSGTGKSSVVNLMAGREIAKTSIETQRCTLHWREHSIAFGGYNFKVFDTVGMEDHQLGMDGYFSAVENAYHLITRLQNEGGIHLLLFCVRAGRYTSTTQANYRLFHEWLCEKKVPIILVITGLEEEQNMDDWWTRSRPTFERHDIIVDAHACITAIGGLDHRQQQLFEESRRLVRDLVVRYCKVDDTYDEDNLYNLNGYNGDSEDNRHKRRDRLLRMLLTKLRRLLPSSHTPKKREIVSTLTKRCGMPREAAEQLARQVKRDFMGQG